MKFKKLFGAVLSCLVVASAFGMAGCDSGSSGGGSYASSGSPMDNYPLVSVSQHGSEQSYIYRASNEPVSYVAHEIADGRTPQQMSAVSNTQMFLVYSDQLYNIQQDPKNPSDSLIEVDNSAFVQHNYDHSFLDGFLTATLVNSLLYHNHYYTVYTPSYHGYGTVYSSGTHSSSFYYHTASSGDISSSPKMSYSRSSSSGSSSYRGGSSSSSSGSYSSKGNSSSSSYSTPPKTNVSGSGSFTKSGSSSSSYSSKSSSSSSYSSKSVSSSAPRTSVSSSGSFTKR